ncbi:hypothetical protein PENTCL1PPCAC_28324, partial [Pristionchus entomophagus]
NYLNSCARICHAFPVRVLLPPPQHFPFSDTRLRCTDSIFTSPPSDLSSHPEMPSEVDRCAALDFFNQSKNANGCGSDFDKSMCWDKLNYGERMDRRCPFQYCTSIPGCERIADIHMVSRYCDLNGDWEVANYSQCLTVVNDFTQCIVGFCRVCPDVLRDVVISVSLTLSIVSVALLVAAIVLFSIFDSIQCRRLAIHKNLAVAFVCRFAVLAVWTVVQSSNLFQDCSTFFPTNIMAYDWICKSILWFVIYFQVASVMWMLIEGAYLYSRFTVFAMRHSDAPYCLYLLAGWGIPFLVVMAWTVVHESSTEPGSFCWLPYAQGDHLWILAGTMGFAFIMNLIFLLAIVVILVQKLGSENTAESRKIWRTIKATLLLVPLLGVSNIPLFYEPQEPSGAYMLVSAILQHSQGIFIAVLYCFLNSEIQNALKRQLSKVPFHFFLRRARFETERTYVPDSHHHANHKLGVPMGELNGGEKKEEIVTSHSHSNHVAADPVVSLVHSSSPSSPTQHTSSFLTPPPPEETSVPPPPEPPLSPPISQPLLPTSLPFNPLMAGSIKSIDGDMDHLVDGRSTAATTPTQ